MLIFSDLHLKPESEEVCFKVLEKVREMASISSDRRVGFLGDFWHMRYQVPVYLLNRLYAELVRFHEAGIQLFLLPGNHDQIDVTGSNALEVFEAFDCVHVFTSPAVAEGILWMPYRKDPEEVVSAVNWARSQDVRHVFAHLPILGAAQNNLHPDIDGIAVGVFKRFQTVLLGHYHKQQTLGGGMAHYVGSPYQTRADEWGQEKGIVEWSPQGMKRINWLMGRRYHRFEGTPTQAMLESVGPDDHVKIVVSTEEDALRIRQAMQEQTLVKELVIEAEELALPAPRFGFTKGTTLTEYARAYIEENAGNQDPEMLLKVFEEIRG